MQVARRAIVALPLAVGLIGSVVLAVALMRNADTVPACEAATPAAADFEVAPFAFDPEKARTYLRAGDGGRRL